ncbi:hypothetical protein CGCS363_v005481 [Colletotrichum siamense]|uniref:uncharacterized protein n=1 Tax=Colletotrichum siamense TaxID=690259 RepID=UPI0018732C7D|nr:uncharacterized protein CGCS363_v005481 [Colletotrichum siamense]KAF5505860.1 hypothetical protein CGCS363_v005481 [Colletotrichum siamense]
MAELAQPPQPLRAPARAQRWRHHQDDREPDRTGDGWNLALMSHIQRRQRETTLLNVIKDLTGLLWTRDRRRPELLPSFAQDAFGSLSEMAFADRLLGPSDPALQRPLHPPSPPPPRAEEPFRGTLREIGDSTAEDDTASQPQTAGHRCLWATIKGRLITGGLYKERRGPCGGDGDGLTGLGNRILSSYRSEFWRFILLTREICVVSTKSWTSRRGSGNYIIRCCYDEDRWQCWHGVGCDGFWGDENADYYEYSGCSYARYCGMEEQMRRLEEISKLEAAALWSATLENPILAAGNSLFPAGLVKSPKAFYEDLHRARGTGHVRGLAHMKFTGFRVVWPEEEPEFIFAMRCCGGIVLLCLGILGARIAYEDWGIAYTAGAFFVALIGIVLIWPRQPGAPAATKSKTA